MSNTGAIAPGTIVNVSNATDDWVNPSNASSTNTLTFASIAIFASDLSGAGAATLKSTNFGFGVSGTINGWVFNLWRAALSNLMKDYSVRLVKGGSASGTNLATGTAWSTTLSAAPAYGTSSSLSGSTLTPGDVNGSTFGVQLSPTIASGSDTGHVNSETLTVYYTAAAGAPAFSVEQLGLNQMTGLFRKLVNRFKNGRRWYLGEAGLILPFSQLRRSYPMFAEQRRPQLVVGA